MNYEKKYKEALERAREWYNDSHITIGLKGNLKDIFPELAESEDERIRKALIDYFRWNTDSQLLNEFTNREAFAWLEKQGEKPQGKTSPEAAKEEKADNQSCVEPIDEAEPKFHEGEWITNGDYTWKIVEVKPLDYILQSQGGSIVDDTISHVDEQFHSFTIEDAKEGDVLYCKSSGITFIMILKCINQNRSLDSYCRYNTIDGFGIDVPRVMTIHDNPKPATKEQRDAFEKAMAEAGYTFDFESKELKEIEPIPAWSEEDERMFKYALDMIEWYSGKNEDRSRLVSDWLKSLKKCLQK